MAGKWNILLRVSLTQREAVILYKGTQSIVLYTLKNTRCKRKLQDFPWFCSLLFLSNPNLKVFFAVLDVCGHCDSTVLFNSYVVPLQIHLQKCGFEYMDRKSSMAASFAELSTHHPFRDNTISDCNLQSRISWAALVSSKYIILYIMHHNLGQIASFIFIP